MTTRCWTLILTVLVSASFTPPIFAGKVQAQTAKGIDVSRYKTYQWLPPRVLTKVGIVDDHPANPLLKEIIERQLSQKGLTEVADGADLLIQAFVLTESVPQLEAVLMAGTGSVTAGSTVVLFDTPIATMGRYNREGTLGINMIDRNTKKSAWFAMVSDSIPNGVLKPKEVRAKLEKAAVNIFKKYPVKK